MKIFWCPSGTVQYDPEVWDSGSGCDFGYTQYCSRGGVMSIVGEETSSPITQTIMSPLKNIPHKNGDQKSNSLWLTFADMSIQGKPSIVVRGPGVNGIRSNHKTTIRRTRPGTVLPPEHFADGGNALHVGGNVTWQTMKTDYLKNGFLNFVRIKLEPHCVDPADIRYPSYWLFPRTD